MAIQRLAIVSIPVSDQDRAKRFYTEVLGFVEGRDSPFRENARWIELRPTAESTLTITLVTWFPSMPPGCLRGLVLLADGLEATFEMLRNRGLSSASAIQRNSPVASSAAFCHCANTDPEFLSFITS